jgi:hypothetical protein
MEIIPVSEAEVKTIIMSLKPKNSTGYDGIPNKILKHCVHFISKPLTYIYNCSLTTGIFQERCKFAIVQPIYKKGERIEINNYRQTSLLTAMSKILAIIMFKRLEQYLESNNILTTEQFGFRKGVHTENAVFSLTDNIITSLNQRQQVGGIFCDLTKPFDCVNHTILLNKLHYYRIRGKCHFWFKSYLENRKQRVCISPHIIEYEKPSSWETVIHGVPQGSIMGPLLFIIYLNDLPYGLH